MYECDEEENFNSIKKDEEKNSTWLIVNQIVGKIWFLWKVNHSNLMVN